jgi:hypothetical protein
LVSIILIIYKIKNKLLPLSKDWAIKQKRLTPYYHETIPDTSLNQQNAKFVSKTINNEKNFILPLIDVRCAE